MADDEVRPAVGRFEWERALRSDPSVTGNRFFVLAVLGSYMNADGTGARVAQATLATATGLSDRTIREHLSWAIGNGWLVLVQRGHRNVQTGESVVSTYRTCTPQPEAGRRLCTTGSGSPVVDATTGSPAPVVGDSETPQPANGSTTTGDPLPPTTYYQEQPSSHEPVTNEPAAAEEKPQRITPVRIFSEMARRRLFVGRRENEPWAPPEGCDPRREKGWLEAQASAFKAQHGFKLDALLARHYRPGGPAKFRNPDWYVFHLERDLAKRDWTQPTWQESRARLDRERAEQEANRLPPERLEEEHAKARRLAAELRERAGLRLVTTEAS